MARLTIDRLVKRYGEFRALDDVSLAVEDGEFVAILGPSGCGKTTLLRQIAGFDKPDAGSIRIGDTVVSAPAQHVPPERRRIGIVFQSYALWPHMTVAENVGYGLDVAGVKDPERRQRVNAALALVELEGFADRRPALLSGGQRQRVALARCLVTEPSLVLLDEPLANLDVHLRAAMEREFARFHERTGTTMVYITHDQAEAMALADRIVLMREGRIEQQGTPEELYHRPATLFAARFFGQPPINALPGRIVRADGRETEVAIGAQGGERITLGPLAAAVDENAEVTVGIRPEALSAVPVAGGVQLAPRKVAFAEWFGGERHVQLGEGDTALAWRTAGGALAAPGDRVALHAARDRIHLFASDGKALPRAALPNS